MPELSEAQLEAFHEELVKHAGPNWHRVIGNASALGGIGAGLGALGGAGVQAVRSYRDAREQGARIGGALASGAAGSLGGAAKGALVGAGLGAAAGAVTPRSLQSLTEAGHGLGAMARFGQRQVHSLTGWTPDGGLGRIRAGAWAARQGTDEAANALRDAVRTGGNRAHAEKQLLQAARAERAAGRAEQMGLTSVPGIARSIRDNGFGKTLAATAAEQWHGGGGTAMKALTVGVPAAGAIAALRAPDQAEGPGKAERVGRELGSTVGGVLGSPLPVAGQMVVGGVLGKAGTLVGRGVDRLRGRRPAGVVGRVQELEPASAQHIASERVMSPAAAGQAPEVSV